MTASRREFLRQSLVGAAGMYWIGTVEADDKAKSANDRPRFAVVGAGGMGGAHGGSLSRLGTIVAICDVDKNHAERYNQAHAGGKAELYGDHRKMFERKDIDLVLIATPDHWHTRVCLDALRSGRDVYCEKPLTLTVDEGRLLVDCAKQTGKILQVGTQQRSSGEFQTAVALVQSGRLGKIQRATCAIGGGPRGGPFKKQPPPRNLDWDRWLGQAPKVDFIPERCHGNFRWWYEYSGGKMTDWGAHHVDIAQWAVAPDLPGPRRIEVVKAEHPVPFKNGWPTVDDRYNTATTFHVRCYFDNGAEIDIVDNAPDMGFGPSPLFGGKTGFGNGICFEGDKGKIFVAREGVLRGEVVDALKTNPLPEESFLKLTKGRRRMGHMENFVASVRDRKPPISDVASHVRHLNTCHLAGIAMRLHRNFTWDGVKGQIVTDPEANAFLKREQRKGYEVS